MFLKYENSQLPHPHIYRHAQLEPWFLLFQMSQQKSFYSPAVLIVMTYRWYLSSFFLISTTEKTAMPNLWLVQFLQGWYVLVCSELHFNKGQILGDSVLLVILSDDTGVLSSRPVSINTKDTWLPVWSVFWCVCSVWERKRMLDEFQKTCSLRSGAS